MSQQNASLKAYGLLVFLMILNVLNFADRTVLGSLTKQITEDSELNISKTQLGFLTGYGFVLFYTAIGIGLGTLADRVHRPRLIAAGLVIWSALTAATGYARNFAQMAGCRGLIGIGEAALTPASLSMLANVFPPRLRAFASGAYYAGIPLGAGMGMIVSGFLLPNYGWRGCFKILGYAGIVFMLPLLFMKDPRHKVVSDLGADPPEPELTPEATSHPPQTNVLGDFLKVLGRSPALISLLIAAALLVYMQASAIFTPAWAQIDHGMSAGEALSLGGFLYLIGGTAGSLVGGVASDFWQRRFGPSGRIWFLAFVIAVFMPLSAWFYLCDVDSPFFKPLWVITSFGTMVHYGSIYSTVPDLAPAHSRATSIAFLIFTVNVIGQGLGPLVTGWYGEQGRFTDGLLISTGVGGLALPLAVFAALRYEKDRQLVAAGHE